MKLPPDKHYRGRTDIDCRGCGIQQNGDGVENLDIDDRDGVGIVDAGGLHHHQVWIGYHRGRCVDAFGADGPDLGVASGVYR